MNDQKPSHVLVLQSDDASSLSDYGHSRFAAVRDAVNDFKTGKWKKGADKRLVIGPWGSKERHEVLLCCSRSNKTSDAEDVLLLKNGAFEDAVSLRSLLSEERFRTKASFFRNTLFTVDKEQDGMLHCTCLKHSFQHTFKLSDQGVVWAFFYPTSLDTRTAEVFPFQDIAWKDAVPIVACALAGNGNVEDVEGTFVASMDVRRALELFGCSEELAIWAVLDYEHDVDKIDKDSDGFTIGKRTVGSVRKQFGGDHFASSVALIYQRWRERNEERNGEEDRTSNVLLAMHSNWNKGSDKDSVNGALQRCGHEELSPTELRLIVSEGLCTVANDDSVALTDKGTKHVEDMLSASNWKQGSCERVENRKRRERQGDETEGGEASRKKRKASSAPPSIDTVLVLVDERLKDAQAKMTKVQELNRDLKKAQQKFVDDESIKETGEPVKDVAARMAKIGDFNKDLKKAYEKFFDDFDDEMMQSVENAAVKKAEEAKQDLVAAETAKMTALELRSKQLALDTDTRRLHEQLSKN